MPALIAPTELAPEIFRRDYLAMTAITLLLAALTCLHRLWATLDRSAAPAQRARHARIGRFEGSMLLLLYAGYYYLLFPATG